MQGGALGRGIRISQRHMRRPSLQHNKIKLSTLILPTHNSLDATHDS